MQELCKSKTLNILTVVCGLGVNPPNNLVSLLAAVDFPTPIKSKFA